MKMQKVKSSNIAEVGYEPEFKELFVKFKSGKTYVYRGVPRDLFLDFKNAKSLGKFLNAKLKDRYGVSQLKKQEDKRADAEAGLYD